MQGDDDELIAEGKEACKGSIAGSGAADALLNPFAATPAPLTST